MSVVSLMLTSMMPGQAVFYLEIDGAASCFNGCQLRDQNTRLLQTVKQFAIEKRGAKLAVERFAVAVLSRAARPDIRCLRAAALEPVAAHVALQTVDGVVGRGVLPDGTGMIQGWSS